MALAFAFSNAAQASIVEYNFSFSDASNVITANFFVDDSITNLDNNVLAAGSYSINGTSYAITSGAFYVDAQLNPAYTGYYIGLVNNDVYSLVAADYTDGSSPVQDVTYFTDYDPILDTNGHNFNRAGTLTKVTAPTATAVPEPEAYAMMLAGLGLVGFAARRKQQAA